MHLKGVRRQLEEARAELLQSVVHAEAGELDPAYRAALKSRNLLFHATRGLAAVKGEALPEMPVVGISGGAIDDHVAAIAAIDRALAVGEDRTMVVDVADARKPYALYLGWLREELGKLMKP